MKVAPQIRSIFSGKVWAALLGIQKTFKFWIFCDLFAAEQSEKRAKEAQSGPATADSSSSVEDMVEELVQM